MAGCAGCEAVAVGICDDDDDDCPVVCCAVALRAINRKAVTIKIQVRMTLFLSLLWPVSPFGFAQGRHRRYRFQYAN